MLPSLTTSLSHHPSKSWHGTSMLVVVSRLSVFDSGCVIIRSVRGCDAAGVVALGRCALECNGPRPPRSENFNVSASSHSSLPALSGLAPRAWQTPQDFPTFSAVQPEAHERLEGRQAQPAAVEGFGRRLSCSGQQASHRGPARLVVDAGGGRVESCTLMGKEWGNPGLASGLAMESPTPLPSPVGPGVFRFFPQ